MKNVKRRIKRISFLFFHLLLFCLASYAQQGVEVRGAVFDEQGEVIIGANVVLKGSLGVGTITDLEGNFKMVIPDESTKVLVFSYIGMETQEVKVKGSERMIIRLRDDSQILDEVVVVGFGQQKKESVVGAITQTSGKVLERAGGVSSVGAALTGNLPGVVTTSSTGMPGEEDPQIIIRGRSSWNNSDPLILVDGIERPMNSVDISSIESISVLKDASATAVFGVKGANGVILITTKRGEEGKASIDIGANMTFKIPSKLPGKYDSYDALRYRNIAIERELGLVPDAWADITPQQEINKYRYPANLTEKERYPNVDWADVLFRDFAISYNANMSVSGGTKSVKYFASADYLHEGDLFEKWHNKRGYNAGYGYNRINVRSNLDFQLTKTTLLKSNLSGSHGVKKGPMGALNEYNMWIGAYSVPSDVFYPVYSDGSWGYYPLDSNGATNSAANLALSGVENITTTRINTDFSLEQDLSMFLNGLNIKGTISWDNRFQETGRGINDQFNAAQFKWIDPKTGAVSYKESYDTNNRFDFQEGVKWTTQGGSVANWGTLRNLFYQLQLNYGASFGKNNVTAMGLFSRQETATGSEIPHYREDWVFRTTYDFAKRYFFEYNGAYNGSEKFSKDNRFAFFSSAAIGWMLSEEKFMKSLDFLDMLKIRGSYGAIGDDNISGRWLYMTQWAYGNDALMGLNPMQGERSPYTWYRETTVGNPDVHWEKVEKINLGVDFSVLNGLLAGNIEFFRDKRTDILISGENRAIPSYYGTTAPTANLGKVRTKGYELELRINKMFQNGLRLWGNFNVTHAEDKVIDRDDPALLPDYQKEEGKRIGQTYSHVHHGYYNTWDELLGSTVHNVNDDQKLPGNYNIIDYNGDGIIDSYDNIPYAYSNIPQNTFNATVGFEWKGFSAFLQFYGVTNVTRQVVFSSFPRRLNTVYDEGTFWSKDNIKADVPMPRWISTPSGYNDGARFMYDGSYIRLKNIELAYTFTQKWVKSIGVKDLKIYLNGNNLWVWSKMPDDRESNFAGTGWASQGAYPTVKRINLGLKFTL